MKFLYRAIKDTIGVFGGWTALIPLIAMPIAGLILHYYQAERLAVLDEWHIFSIYILQAGGAVFLTLLAINLFLAPYRILTEENSAKDDEIAELNKKFDEFELKQLDSRPFLKIKIITLVYGGKNQENETQNIIIVSLSIINSGGLETICDDWNVSAITPDGTDLEAFFPYIQSVDMADNVRNSTRLTWQDTIFEKTNQDPVQPRTRLNGWLPIGFHNPIALEVSDDGESDNYGGIRITISCKDYLENEYSHTFTMKGKDDKTAFDSYLHSQKRSLPDTKS